MMTCQKLYAKHFVRYEKQETSMFNEVMRLKMNEQELIEKNLSLEQQFCGLHAEIDKLRYRLRQKNIQESNLRRTYLSDKKQIVAVEKNKLLKIENELIKLKSTDAQTKDTTKLENNKIKENMKSLKTLHKDQLKLKDARIADLNSTIKSLKTKITTLEKSEAKLQSNFVDFQRQSSTNMAKLEHRKELFHIKEQKKKDLDNEKKLEKMREKEKQKRKLEEAIGMNEGFTPTNYNKGIHDKIINNFRDKNNRYNNTANTATHLPFTGTPQMNQFWNEPNMAAMFQASREVNGINNTIDLTATAGHLPTNIMAATGNSTGTMFPTDFFSFLNNLTGNVDTTSNESSRAKKKVS